LKPNKAKIYPENYRGITVANKYSDFGGGKKK
jgi:hypothetical protein